MRRSLSSLGTWAAAAAMLLLAMPNLAQDPPRRIAIEIEGKAEFDVVYRRALSNATGAVLGGWIGAGIQSGIEANEDSGHRAAIYPYVAQKAWRDVFIKTMTETLAEKGLVPVWIEDGADPAPGTAEIYLVLYPKTFGFRIVDSSTLMMASFVEFEAVYSSNPITDENRPEKEPFYITDKSQVEYNQLLGDTAGINPRIESVLKAAARRLTNKIVYNTK